MLLSVFGFTLASGWGAVRVERDPAAGFHWPYYLSIPAAVREQAETGGIVHILVVPNNSGKTSKDLSYQEEHLVRAIDQNYAPLAGAVGTVLLCPVFPRPSAHSRLYTHALDRDSLTTDLHDLERLDLQLIAMFDHAAQSLESSAAGRFAEEY